MQIGEVKWHMAEGDGCAGDGILSFFFPRIFYDYIEM